MAKLRLIHNQTTRSKIYLTELETGLPNEKYPARVQKQVVYIPFNFTSIVDSEIVVDTTIPGFVDLVYSDKVLLSQDRGQIKSFIDDGFLTAIDIPSGALAAPTISLATEDTTTSATSATDDGLVTITGTGFTSLAPYVSSVVLTPTTGAPVTLTSTAITGGGGTFTATSITIPAAVHGFTDDGTDKSNRDRDLQ
jgi:hypothetical protein